MNGLKQGYGEVCWTDGSQYSGHFKDGLKDGFGEFCDEKGNVVRGIWKDGGLIYKNVIV